MHEADVKPPPPSPTTGATKPSRLTNPESIIFGSAALVLLAITLVSLVYVQQNLVSYAQRWDLDRVERYIRLCRMKLEADARAAPDEESLRELESIGLFIDVFPPDKKIPSPNPRYVPALRSVEAWDRVRGPDGQPVSVIRIGRYDGSTRLALQGLRFYTAAGLIGGILLIGTIWWALRRTVFLRLQKLAADISSRTTANSAAAVASTGPVSALASAVQEALAAQDRAAVQRQTLLDHHSEAACTGTTDGTLLEVNAAYCRLFGKTREELVGSNYLDLIPPADRTEALNNLNKLSARHPESTVEHRVVLPDGSMRWMRWRDTAVLDEEGSVKEVLSFGLDITAEKNLTDRIDNLRGAFDQMQSLARTGSLTWDFASDRMDLTSEALYLLGLESSDESTSAERLLGTVTPADRDALRDLFARAREDGTPFEQEFGVLLPDGSRRVLQSRAEVRADPRTKLLTQLTCTLRDITALRDAEAATRRELRFREAVEQSLASGIVASDDNGRILSVNPAFCSMTGWTEQELLGHVAPYPYWPEEEIPAIRRAFDTTLSGHTPEEGYQLRFCRKDGSRFDVLIKVAPLLDDRDRRLGWLGAVTDVTAIQQVRREITVTNERLQLAQDVVEFGIWDWDPQRDQLFWDRDSFALFGEPQATDPEAVWARVLPAPERERLTYELQRLIAAGGSSGQDLIRVRWPDGSPHVISSTYLILRDDRGQAVRVFGVNRDLTRELEAENELRDANERLAAALEGGNFGTFEHVIGQGDYNYNLANYEINGIDPSITDPAELFAAWQKTTGGFFPQLLAEMSALPATQTNYAYEFTARPANQEPRRVRVNLFIERNRQGHPVRLVGITRRLD